MEVAFQWACHARKGYSPNSDIWDVRHHWKQLKSELCAQLCQGRFRFSPLRQYRFPDQRLTLWSAIDAIVLRAMAQVLSAWIRPQLDQVYHVKGQGGIHGALAFVQQRLGQHTFVMNWKNLQRI